MRVLVIGIAILLAATVIIFWERSQWTRDRDAQCEAVQPLVAAHAQKNDLFKAIGAPTSEEGLADWSRIEKAFGGNNSKIADIKQHLREGGRLLIYSRSNSIMFVYLDSDGRAVHASCFLQ